MAILEDTFTAALAAVRSAAMTLPSSVAAVQPLSDGRLLSLQTQLADARRLLDAASSLVAGEIGFRSRPELGYDGLAQRSGFRTAEKLVQHTTQSTARDAVGLVSVGTLVHEAVAVDPALPWLVAVGTAVSAGALSVAAAQAIRDGVGAPSEAVTTQQLGAIVELLIIESGELHAGDLLKRARQLRDDLDAAGVADRERQIHLERSFRRVTRPNGLSRYIIDPDLESAAYWDELYDTLTSPRRGGPRFVGSDERAWADAMAADERTTEQYVHDAVTELVRVGVSADHGIVGARQPAVRVMVTERSLRQREGVGFIEGASTPVSIATVERIACAEGTVPLVFDDAGQALNVGREHRLFTTRQRLILAARDGGCRWIGCDRPPSWCEAHHVEHWHRDRGKTDVADGILLCRHHHLLLHNNEWSIEHDGDGYWLTAPPGSPVGTERRRMPSTSAALRELLAQPA